MPTYDEALAVLASVELSEAEALALARGGEHDGRVCTASVREPPHLHAPECPRRKVEVTPDGR